MVLSDQFEPISCRIAALLPLNKKSVPLEQSGASVDLDTAERVSTSFFVNLPASAIPHTTFHTTQENKSGCIERNRKQRTKSGILNHTTQKGRPRRPNQTHENSMVAEMNSESYFISAT